MKTELYLLSLKEYQKFFPDLTKRQTERLVGEFALRTVLAQTFQSPWEFPKICRDGKPFLTNLKAEFNISHTKDTLILAVGDAPLGVDIETITPKPDTTIRKIAQKYFSEEEINDVNKRGLRAFYEAWTRLESYGKFTGEGIRAGLPDTSQVDFFRAEWDNAMICVCSEKNHLPEEILPFSVTPTKQQILFLNAKK